MQPSILSQEILQQPAVIRELIANETPRMNEIVRSLRNHFKYVLIAARGTSDNAARYAQYLFGAHNRLQVALATPSLFTLYSSPPNLEGALIIGISQSGQSPDIVSVLAEGKRQGCPTLAITNLPQSPLAQTADFVIPLHAGEERAVAATKTYTASLAALALLSIALQSDEERMQQLIQVPTFMQNALDELSPLMQRTERYRYMEQCAVIGRGFNYSTAFEIALKVKELTRIVAEPYSSADFRHGPIATVTNGFPVILVAPRGAAAPDMSALLAELQQLDAEVIVISDDRQIAPHSGLFLPIPANLPEWLSPMVCVVPGQLFALHLAQARGLNPDHPKGLRKVTETR